MEDLHLYFPEIVAEPMSCRIKRCPTHVPPFVVLRQPDLHDLLVLVELPVAYGKLKQERQRTVADDDLDIAIVSG
jgi:hypothetical protein